MRAAVEDQPGATSLDARRELGTVRRVLLVAIAVSIVHYADNTLRFDDYENGGTPGFIRR